MGAVPPRPRHPRVLLVYLCRYCRAESREKFETCARCGAERRPPEGAILGGFVRASMVLGKEKR